MSSEDKNGWQAHKVHVVAELARINASVTAQREDIIRIRENLAALKVKAGAWGLIGGLIPVLILVILKVTG